MATNNFKSLAAGVGANVLSQADYEALTAILAQGLLSGILPSNRLNKILRQATVISATIGQFINDLSGLDALDNGDLATLLANFKTSIAAQATLSQGAAYSSLVNLTGSTTLNSTYVKKLTTLSGTGGIVVTLPAASAVTAGGVITLFSKTSSTANSVVRAGSDTITVSNSTATSLSLGSGDTLTLVSDGVSTWNAVAGTAQLASSATFKGNLVASGWIPLPGGLLLQWGTIAAGTENVDITANWPVAFQTAVFSAVLTDSATTTNNAVVWASNNLNLTTFTAHYARSGLTLTGTNRNAFYVAIGK